MKESETVQSNLAVGKNENLDKINKSSKNPTSNQEEIKTEQGTTVSTLFFLYDDSNVLGQINEEGNKEKPIPKDTVSTSTGTDSNSSQKDSNSVNSNENKKMGFYGKTKKFAGNIWNTMKNINIKNLFPKTEYVEYRNANGDIVKVPKKKIPLKKKKINDNVNYMVNQDKKKEISNFHYAADGMYKNY